MKMGTFDWTIAVLILLLMFTSGSYQLCDDSSEVTTGVCARISKDLEKALLEDEGNQFRMRKAFFYSPTASPVLLKVVYNVTFGENITTATTDKEPCCYTSFTQNETTEEEEHPQSCTNVNFTAERNENTALDIPDCFNSSTVKNLTTNMLEEITTYTCSNSIEFKQRNYVYGWTSSGVYVVFRPMVLTVMQLQIPLAALRIVHMTLNQRGPEADTFLWDGSYDLPTLHLNLHITSLSCIPTEDLFTSVLEDFNTLVRSVKNSW